MYTKLYEIVGFLTWKIGEVFPEIIPALWHATTATTVVLIAAGSSFEVWFVITVKWREAKLSVAVSPHITDTITSVVRQMMEATTVTAVTHKEVISVGPLHSGLEYWHAAASAFRQPSYTWWRFRFNTYARRAFAVAGPMAWNTPGFYPGSNEQHGLF